MPVVDKRIPDKLLSILAHSSYNIRISRSRLSKWPLLNHFLVDLTLSSTCGLRTQKFIGILSSTSGKIRTKSEPLISTALARMLIKIYSDKMLIRKW